VCARTGKNASDNKVLDRLESSRKKAGPRAAAPVANGLVPAVHSPLIRS
jgi:hypothetical protein